MTMPFSPLYCSLFKECNDTWSPTWIPVCVCFVFVGSVNGLVVGIVH